MLKKLLSKKYIIYSIAFLLFFILMFNEKLIVDTYVDLVTAPQQVYKTYFYGWENTVLLGESNTQNYSIIFPIGFLYYFFSLFFPLNITQSLVFASLLFVAFVSFIIFVKNEYNTDNPVVYIGALLYVFNPFTLLNIRAGTGLLYPYSVLPLQLYCINIILLRKNFFIFILFFALTNAYMSATNPPIAAVNIIIMAVYLLYIVIANALYKNVPRILYRLLLALLFSVLLNIYWIIGMLLFYLHIPGNRFASILSDTLSSQNGASSYLNIFRALGLWSFDGGWGPGRPFFTFANLFLKNPLWILSLFLIPIFAFSALLIPKNRKHSIWIMALILIAIPMAVGTHEGMFATLYEWSYYHIPLFSMFRSSYKLVQLYIFGISLFITMLLLQSKGKKLILLSLLIVVLILINAYPFIAHEEFLEMQKISGFPSYYYNAQKFFQKDQTINRIFLLPEQYSVIYKWGFTSINPEFIWNKGLVARQGGWDKEISNVIALRLYSDVMHGNYDDANKIFQELNVTYIVQRNDYDWESYKEFSHSPDTIRKALQPYQKIKTFGALDVYKIPEKYTSAVILAPNVIFKKLNNNEYRIYLKNINQKQNLSFLETFHRDWKLFPVKNPNSQWCASKNIKDIRIEDIFYHINECTQENNFYPNNDITFAFKKPIFETSHMPLYTYANTWVIDGNYIKSHLSPLYYRKNADGSVNAEFILYFQPQAYFYLGSIISGITFFVIIVYMISYLMKKKRVITAST